MVEPTVKAKKIAEAFVEIMMNMCGEMTVFRNYKPICMSLKIVESVL
jgi:hypothetical protein